MELFRVPYIKIEYGEMLVEAKTPEDALLLAMTTYESFNSDKMNDDPSCEVLHRDLKMKKPYGEDES